MPEQDAANVVPPEEQLTAPPPLMPTEADEETEAEHSAQARAAPRWLVVARNRRVNRDWEALLLSAPENARRCYEDL